jgi:hypothetical protein
MMKIFIIHIFMFIKKMNIIIFRMMIFFDE